MISPFSSQNDTTTRGNSMFKIQAPDLPRQKQKNVLQETLDFNKVAATTAKKTEVNFLKPPKTNH
jgi:hypothetical protein